MRSLLPKKETQKIETRRGRILSAKLRRTHLGIDRRIPLGETFQVGSNLDPDTRVTNVVPKDILHIIADERSTHGVATAKEGE